MPHSIAVDNWLTWLEHNKGRRPTTVQKYRSYIVALAAWLAARDIGVMTAPRDQLETFCGLHLHAAGVSPRSRKPYVAAIRGFYAWAHRENLIQTNPAKMIPFPEIGDRLPRGMTLNNAERMLMAPDLSTFLGLRDSAILHLLIGCGLRRSGLLALNESDLSLSSLGDKEFMFIRVREKGDKERYIPAPAETRVMLQGYLAHPYLKTISRVAKSGDQILFVSTNNHHVPEHAYYGEARRLSASALYSLIQKHALAAGVPIEQAHPHALRHLYGTELAEDDVHIIKMQALMGHLDANTTKQYTHVAMRSLAAVVERSNPLAKIKTPAKELARLLKR